MDNSRKNLHCLPLERSFEVTRGHQPSFANNFWSKRDRDVGLASVRSSWPGESNDMQYDPFRSSHDLGLTWPEVKLWPWPFKVIIYMVRRALTRQTQWCQIRCSTFKINDFIVEKTFWKILEFWPLVTSILAWAIFWQFWVSWMTEMTSKWFFASFRTLPFVFLYGDQEPRSWGGVQTPPPPPAGGGKSRGPAGRGLRLVSMLYWSALCHLRRYMYTQNIISEDTYLPRFCWRSLMLLNRSWMSLTESMTVLTSFPTLLDSWRGGGTGADRQWHRLDSSRLQQSVDGRQLMWLTFYGSPGIWKYSTFLFRIGTYTWMDTRYVCMYLHLMQCVFAEIVVHLYQCAAKQCDPDLNCIPKVAHVLHLKDHIWPWAIEYTAQGTKHRVLQSFFSILEIY